LSVICIDARHARDADNKSDRNDAAGIARNAADSRCVGKHL
jgi:hypothetical protein